MNDALVATGVQVGQIAFQDEGHRFEATMRMGTER
jgi:hypothetical protein